MPLAQGAVGCFPVCNLKLRGVRRGPACTSMLAEAHKLAVGT